MPVEKPGKILCVIPAKLGSTRLPGKNIKKLGDKTLLEWTAEAAKQTELFDEIVVSTESEVVAELAKRYGLSVPFMRPEKLAHDPFEVEDVALHAIDEVEKLGRQYTTLFILLPTCPFRSVEDIRAAYQVFLNNKAQYLMSVNAMNHKPYNAMCLEGDLLSPCFPEYLFNRESWKSALYRPNGAIHIVDIEDFKSTKSYFTEPLYTYVMPWERSVDIDTEEDFKFAEFLLKETAGE